MLCFCCCCCLFGWGVPSPDTVWHSLPAPAPAPHRPGSWCSAQHTQKHFRWIVAAPFSLYSWRVYWMSPNVPNDPNIDPPIQAEYFLCESVMILISMSSLFNLHFNSFNILALNPGNIDDPPDNTMLPHKSGCKSPSHFRMESNIKSTTPFSTPFALALGNKEGLNNVSAMPYLVSESTVITWPSGNSYLWKGVQRSAKEKRKKQEKRMSKFHTTTHNCPTPPSLLATFFTHHHHNVNVPRWTTYWIDSLVRLSSS